VIDRHRITAVRDHHDARKVPVAIAIACGGYRAGQIGQARIGPQCLEVGAAGYVLKDTPAPQLVTAVRDVYKGGKYLSSQVLGKLVEDFRARVRDAKMRPRMSTLTPREREILKLLAEGNSVKEIAVLLGLSVKTVEAHKFNLMRKLDIHNKAQLVTYAIQKKIIKIPVNQ